MGFFDRDYDYDWHYDRDHDGKIDFFENYMRLDEFDRINKSGMYAEEAGDDEDLDDPDEFDRELMDEDELDELDDLDMDF